LGCMTGLDRQQRRIQLAPIQDENGEALIPARQLDYDYLVVAVGSNTNDFNTTGAAEHCIFLDTRAQAERFHTRLINQYLKAQVRGEMVPDESINVAIIGAGATGVELAAELHHAALMLRSYGLDRVRAEDLNISLVEAGPRILPALPERLASKAAATLNGLGVHIRTGSPVKEVQADGLLLADGQFIPASLKVWAAGIRAPAFLAGLGLETNRINQLLVDKTLRTADERIFAFGDCAACP